MEQSSFKDREQCIKHHPGDFCDSYSFYGSIHRGRQKHALNYRINPGHKQWITYIMGAGVPLLNEYKLEFFSKRFPQTILGGLKLRLGYDAPFYVYINQLIVFWFPFILGGLFTLLVELDAIHDYIAVYVYGGTMFVYVLLAQLISLLVQHFSHVQDLPIIKKRNLLAEEDEVDFISCCDGDTFKFVVPSKKYRFNIVVHALVAGPMCGLGLWYLLPTTLNKLFEYNTGGVVLIFILGWFALLIAQYPLTTTAPPETATYRTTDWLELSAIMRAFYVYVFIMFDLLHRYLSSDFLLTNQVLHVLFVFLPILWTLGVLAPVDTFLLYALEQAHVFLFGGSFTASDLRLVVLSVLSAAVFLGAYYIKVSLGTILLSACAGYLLSTDLGGLGSQIIHFVRSRNKVGASHYDVREPAKKKSQPFLWKWGPLEGLYHLVMLVIVGVMAGLLNKEGSSFSSNTWKIIGYVIIGLCVVEKVLRDIQGVFIVFTLWRNMLFPRTIQSQRPFHDRKHYLRPLGFIRRGLINWVCPLVMLAYLSITITSSAPSSVALTAAMSRSRAVWYTFGTIRAFRWIWQSTAHSLLELSVVHLVLVTMTTDTTVVEMGVPILFMITSLCRDRLYQFSNKLYFFFALLISSWTDKKQRRASTVPIIVASLILLPLIVAVIAMASAVSVPLLSLFTLPLFFLSFPRPLRSWPEEVGASANSCPDTNFYKQLTPELTKAFSTGFANGSMGEATPGNHYLVRFQDRLVWVMVLERGAAYCTLSVKGLELQETSCHTAEAARIDEIFENAFEVESASALGKLNEYPLHCLTPTDACYLNVYSDARNVLTGVIDSPNSTELTQTAFLKSLVWVLLKYVNKKKRKEDALQKSKKQDKELSFVLGSDNNKKNVKELEYDTVDNKLPSNKQLVLNGTKKSTLPPLVPGLRQETRSPSPPPVLNPSSKKRTSSWGSLDSFTDSIFSDDGSGTKKKTANKAAPKPAPPPVINQSSRTKSPDIEDLFDELDIGMPAFDVTKPKPQQQNKFTVGKGFGNTIYKPQTNLAGSPDFKSPYSSQMSMPVGWRELPLDRSQVSRLLNKFPSDWYRHVLSCLDWNCEGMTEEKVLTEVKGDDTLLNSYSQLIMACYSIFDNQGGYGGPSYLYKCYMGDVSINAMWDWLGEHKELQNLVKQSFRYGFKLMLDQILLGELTSPEEWQEALEDYDQNWYIGLEREPEWTVAVLDSQPNLFSLGHSNTQNTYNSRTLTLQKVDVNIGRLNGEVVRGQWANLGLELLYMTNDDEERYSIQAHPVVLRNLTVQAADPPLGYPIYSSQPISVPLL